MNHAEHLRCVKCYKSGGLKFYPDSFDILQAHCNFCGHKLPVHQGIPDFAEHIEIDDPKFTRSQRIMNSRLFGYVYESPIWRPLHTWIGSGISMAKEVEQVLQMSGAGKTEMLLDMACGTGHYARSFARRLPEAKVYGLDISLGMLTQGHKIAQKRGLSTVMFIRGDIHSLPFSDRSVDQVNCGGALHLFPTVAPILNEVARVLRPGGIFTAMTLTFARGLINKLQMRLNAGGRATFFVPDQLLADLKAVGFTSFSYRQHRVTLLFSAIRG
jgi:SAM-dependent methyltransferase